MLPFCFLWSLSTRGDHRYVIYDGSWFVCRNKQLGNELQAAELNAYLVAKDSFLVAKAFQKLKMCRGLYTQSMVGVAKKSPKYETLTGSISVIFYQKFINDPSFSF